MSDKIRIFTSPHCAPCVALKKKISPKELAKIEFVDIHTEEGYKEAIRKNIMGIPYAEKNGKKCRIVHEGGKIRLDCI